MWYRLSLLLLGLNASAFAGQANSFSCHSHEAKPKYQAMYETSGFVGIGSLSFTIDGKEVRKDKKASDFSFNHAVTLLGDVATLSYIGAALHDGTVVRYSVVVPKVDLRSINEYKFDAVAVISTEPAPHRANPDVTVVDPANTYIPVKCTARQVFFATGSKFPVEAKEEK